MAELTLSRLVGLALCGVCGLTLDAAMQPGTPSSAQEEALAASFAVKLASVVGHATGEDAPESSRETRVTEAEVNAYLRSNAPLPAGISEPHLTFVGNGRATSDAVVDLDRIRALRQGGWFDPLSYLTGRLSVTATSVLRASEGVARVTIEHAEVGGIPVAGRILRELIASYTKSDETPDGVDVDGEHPLPYGIREIQIHPGEVRIVQ